MPVQITSSTSSCEPPSSSWAWATQRGFFATFLSPLLQELTKGKLPTSLRRCPFFLVLASSVQEVGTHLRPRALGMGGRLWWEAEGLTGHLAGSGRRAHTPSQLLPGLC